MSVYEGIRGIGPRDGDGVRGAHQCPDCGSSDVWLISAFGAGGRTVPDTGLCSACGCNWESFDPALLTESADPLSPFRKPCDNCAFHKNSPERRDEMGWLALECSFINGVPFVCHKGVPICRDGTESHRHPTTAAGHPDIDNMRLCAGYIRFVERNRAYMDLIKQEKA